MPNGSHAPLRSARRPVDHGGAAPESAGVSLALISPRSGAELSAAHRAAVAHGGHDTGASAELERLASTPQLLSYLIPRLPEIAISTFAVQTLAGAGWDERLAATVEQLRTQSAGGVRLGQRALEVHARDTGYRLESWTQVIVETTGEVLERAHDRTAHMQLPSPLEQIRSASGAVARALGACERDRMAVPEHVCETIAHLLVLFMFAGELQRRER